MMSGAGVGREEAAARSRLISVYDYDVTLDLTTLAHTKSFTSSSTVRFHCVEPGARTWIDIIADVVTSIRLNGAVLDPRQTVHGARIMLSGLQADNTLTVCAQHSAGNGRGVTRSLDTDGRVYIWTQFEPCDARRAFACFDQPDLKAQFRFTATAARNWKCVSNSSVTSIRRVGSARSWSFAPTPVLPTYVTALCAGPFHVVEDADHVPIALYAPRSRAAALDRDAQELLRLTRDGLECFGDHFGASFAGDRYSCVFLPGQPGAMENYGCVTWNDSALPLSRPTADRRARRRFVLLHEMAHMWFGDLVSLTWWDGLWLKESFADWAGVWASGLLGGEAAWPHFLLTHKVRGYAADQSPTTHPISRDVNDVEAAEANFDMVTYAKGAGVLRQLSARLGEDAFLAGLRSYFEHNAWQNADLHVLLQELGDASGQDLGDWAESWLEESGVNTLRIDAPVVNGRYRDVTIRQIGKPEREHRLRIGCYDRDAGGNLSLHNALDIRVAGKITPLPQLDGQPVGVLLPNDNDMAFAKTRCDSISRQGILEGAHTLPDPLSRASAVAMLREMMLDAQLSASAFAIVVGRCLEVESDPVVAGCLVTVGVEAATVYTATEHREESMASLCAAILRTRDATDDAQCRDILSLGLAAVATTSQQTSELSALLADPDTAQATRWAAITRLAAVGLIDDGPIEREAERDLSPDAAAQARSAYAARPSPAAKDAAWETLLQPAGLTTTDRTLLAAAFWQPGQGDILKAYARAYVQRLPALAGAGAIALQSDVVRHTFPMYGVDDDFVTQVTGLTNSVDMPLKMRHEIIDQAHRLAVVLKARQVDEPSQVAAATTGE